MTKDKLKPCPFCGEIPLLVDATDTGLHDKYCWYISCEECDIQIPNYLDTKSNVINIWNTRKGEIDD